MTDIERYAHVGIEKLAQELYEAQSLTPQAYPFTDWCNLPEQGKEGYIAQARRGASAVRVVSHNPEVGR